ncbi:hypothetical protein [uncultured Litoreibacter sp.]|uniref:hypothetical protein n=1 Tax=uncultured Litoreibacter sp. TaxID=1392394 RepID=UPI00261DD748|nr:hypothetical protein [uncultured Litoreibacter sp.]
MLSIIADALMTASRQEPTRWPDKTNPYADRFVSDPNRRQAARRRSHNPYSYFQ